MKRFDLNNKKYKELKIIAQNMKLPIKRGKEDLIKEIQTAFKKYEKYKRDKVDKYRYIKQLGYSGKEGTTYLVENIHNNRKFAMKKFRKYKSSKRLRQEAELQNMAAAEGISPLVIDIDTVSKYIVMEKMNKHLLDVLKQTNGVLSTSLQKQIIKIFRKLDYAGVFHGDANLTNYMLKNSKLYIIDFGMAKEITVKLMKKLGTKTPNIDIMTLGFILKLRDFGIPKESYKILIKHLNQDQIKQFKLNC